jgi:DNA-binding transcriptional LysR family regulator
MDFRQIIYFLSIYDAGSLTKASRKEHVAQPALSMQLRRLEEKLGVSLFERRRHGVVPTVAGKRFYELCRSIVDDISQIKAEMSAFSKELSGRLNVGLPPALNRSVLGIFLPKFVDAYPNVEVTVREAFSGTLADWVHNGTVDFAIASRPQDAAGLSLRMLHSEPLVLASNNPEFGPMLQPVDLRTIKAIKLVVPLPHHAISRQVTDYLHQIEAPIERLMYVDGYVATIEMIRKSRDWSTITALSVLFPEIEDDTVPIHPIAGTPMTFHLHLMHKSRDPLSPVGCEFVRMLETAFVEFTARYTALLEKRKMAS